jgi:hypothetical protein
MRLPAASRPVITRVRQFKRFTFLNTSTCQAPVQWNERVASDAESGFSDQRLPGGLMIAARAFQICLDAKTGGSFEMKSAFCRARQLGLRRCDCRSRALEVSDGLKYQISRKVWSLHPSRSRH